jgi:hypothetical protein
MQTLQELFADVLEGEVVGNARHGVFAHEDGTVARQFAHPGGDVHYYTAGAIAPARPGRGLDRVQSDRGDAGVDADIHQ